MIYIPKVGRVSVKSQQKKDKRAKEMPRDRIELSTQGFLELYYAFCCSARKLTDVELEHILAAKSIVLI